MASVREDERSRIEDEAADWLILLSEESGDAALRARFDRWLAEDPRHAESWARATRAYRLIGTAPPAHAGQWRRPARHSARWAAGALAAAALAACWLLVAPSPGSTGTGETALVSLPDGSTAHLGPHSSMALDFTDGRRTVKLTAGEAFFDVTHDPDHPFRVEAGEARVTVLGTQFEVRRAAHGAEVAVRRGHVRVEDGAVSADLLAGDRISLEQGEQTDRGTEPPDEVASWIDGKLVLHERPLGDVIAALRPYYRGIILVRGESLADRRVSGVYDLRDPVETLRELAASHGAALRQISPWILLISEK